MTGTETRHRPHESKNADRIRYALLGACVALLLVDALYHKHTYFSFEGWFGFYGLYGFVVCVVIVLIGIPLRKLLLRGEDYDDC